MARRSLIYEPKGAAREYAPLALNLYDGCAHGCRYCYVPGVLRRSLDAWCDTAPRPRCTAEDIVAAAYRLRGSAGPVFLCFTCDPYPPIEAGTRLTRAAIEILNNHDLPVRILTKAGLLATRDMDLLSRHPRNEFGVTLTCRHGVASLHFEPEAALPWSRIENLRRMKAGRIRTWVSLEPVLDPAETLACIRWSARYVDKFYLGKLNHMAPPRPVDWPAFREEAVRLFERLGVEYEIKKALREA